MTTTPTSAPGTTTAKQRTNTLSPPTSPPRSGSTTTPTQRSRHSTPTRSHFTRRHNSSSQHGGDNNNTRLTMPSLSSHQNTPSSNNSSSSSTFHPKLIISQIIALQCFYYAILGFIFQINHVIFATSITMDRIFTSKYLDVWSATGWIDNSAVLTSSVAGAFLLAIIVEKSKKCLDFSVTLFFLHILISAMYGGLPKTWDWWIVHLMGMMIMILLGEYLCSRVEMMDIPLLVL
uniref:Protein SYS1 homolog n=1 Tax=Helicotheca tamesis TaxID=374047 RepID=A0A7S2N3N9_9STRA